MQEKFELLLGYYYCNFEIHNSSPNDDDNETNERTSEQMNKRNGVRFRQNLLAIVIRRLNFTLRW